MLGDDLVSRDVTVRVPSALAGLTAGFGKEPGVPPPPETPSNRSAEAEYGIGKRTSCKQVLWTSVQYTTRVTKQRERDGLA